MKYLIIRQDIDKPADVLFKVIEAKDWNDALHWFLHSDLAKMSCGTLIIPLDAANRKTLEFLLKE